MRGRSPCAITCRWWRARGVRRAAGGPAHVGDAASRAPHADRRRDVAGRRPAGGRDRPERSRPRGVGVPAAQPAGAAGAAGREAAARGLQRASAAGSARRFLVQPLQRLRRQDRRQAGDARVRARRHPAPRARALSRSAGRGREEPRDAVLSGQLVEPIGTAERELRARADGAAHARRRRRLHAARRRRRRARVHRLDAAEAARGERLRVRRQGARSRGEARARPHAESRARHRGRRGGARSARAAPVDGALHRRPSSRAGSSPTIRRRRSSIARRGRSSRPTAICARSCGRS